MARSKLSALKEVVEARKAGKSILAGETDPLVASTTLHLDQIRDRAGGDTRPLNSAHIEELVKSIALLGLIEPLVVDNQNRLLAGGHRRVAILQLWEQDAETFKRHFSDGVPVHRIAIDSEKEPELAVQIEIAENEQRRDYTPTEVRAIAERFREAGLSQDRGRPTEGQVPLIPALMAVVGKSRATVHRYLAEVQKDNVSPETLSKPDYTRILQQAQKALAKWLEKPRKSKQEKEAVDDLAKAVARIEELLENS